MDFFIPHKYMEKIIYGLVITLLAGCGASTPTLDEVRAVSECYYPDTVDVEGPAWVCDGPVDGVALKAVGVAEPTQAGFAFQRRIAQNNAQIEIAVRVRSRVRDIIRQYTEQIGNVPEEQTNAVITVTTQTITDVTLQQVELFASIKSPNNYFYVLMGITDDNFNAFLDTALRSSIQQNADDWGAFLDLHNQDQELLAKELITKGIGS